MEVLWVIHIIIVLFAQVALVKVYFNKKEAKVNQEIKIKIYETNVIFQNIQINNK